MESAPCSTNSRAFLTISSFDEYLIKGIETVIKVLGAAFLIRGTFSSGFANIRSSIASSAALASSASETRIWVSFFLPLISCKSLTV